MCDDSDAVAQTDTPPRPDASHAPDGRAAPLRALLARLATDGGEAGDAYESLRRRLIGYFRLHFTSRADELADIVLERLGRRLHEGTVIDHVPAYALGIARHVVMETQAREQRERLQAAEWTRSIEQGAAEPEPQPDPALAALTRCLNELGPAEAAFILSYHAQDGGAARIRHRRELAMQLGLSDNAARNRALRLRERLERCVAGQLAAVAAKPEP